MDENRDQIEYWNGPAGERWAREQASTDRAFAAFARRLLERAALRPGAHVLDVGCGCGTTTLAAAHAVGPVGSVVGVDVSEPMVTCARERSAGRPNVSYVRADASVHVFQSFFDAMISRFGVMFFRKPALAFARMGEALHPDATLSFVCWRGPDENEWVGVPGRELDPFVAAEPPVTADDPGPFSFADASRISRVLVAAGYRNIAIEPFDADVVLSEEGHDEAVRFVLSTGPTARRLRDADAETKARASDVLSRRLRACSATNRVTLRGAVWIVTATRPAPVLASNEVRTS